MRAALFSLCLVPVLFAACSSSDDPKGGSSHAGAAGQTSGGAGAGGAAGSADDSAGAAGTSGAADAAGSDGVSCVELGQGQIKLVVTGLPATVAASITLSGAHEESLSESTTLTDVDGGSYTVSAERVYDADPLVRTAYDAQISRPEFCLQDGRTQTVTVSYSKIVPSNQLWTIGIDSTLFGFASDKLTSSGSPVPTSTAKLPVGTSMAFDRDGNLWVAGASVADPTVARYAAVWLAGVGVPHPDFAYNLPIACVPAIKGVALDGSGNVWLSACGKQVFRIDRPEETPGANEEPVDIAADAVYPLPGSAAGQSPTTGGFLLFRMPRETLDFRPLELEFASTALPGKGSTIRLDV